MIGLAFGAVLGLILPMYAGRRIYRGRIFTMWLRRLCQRQLHFGMGCWGALGIRIGQVFVASQLLVHFGLGNRLWLCLAAFAVPYIDDRLTGDDDEWRKFKGWARNRVKWRMELPAPPEPEYG